MKMKAGTSGGVLFYGERKGIVSLEKYIKCKQNVCHMLNMFNGTCLKIVS